MPRVRFGNCAVRRQHSDHPGSFSKPEGKLFTLTDEMKLTFTRPSDFVDDGLKPVFRVTTRLGRSVEATLPHPFLTVRGWTKLAELKAGDHIAVPRKLDVFGRETARECEVKLLAYLIGDGCLTHTCPSFTNSNPANCEDFSQAVADFGGMTVRRADSNGKRTPTLRVVANPDFIATHRRQFGLNLRAAIAASGEIFAASRPGNSRQPGFASRMAEGRVRSRPEKFPASRNPELENVGPVALRNRSHQRQQQEFDHALARQAGPDGQRRGRQVCSAVRL